mgnify:CR=1 FL=1
MFRVPSIDDLIRLKQIREPNSKDAQDIEYLLKAKQSRKKHAMSEIDTHARVHDLLLKNGIAAITEPVSFRKSIASNGTRSAVAVSVKDFEKRYTISENGVMALAEGTEEAFRKHIDAQFPDDDALRRFRDDIATTGVKYGVPHTFIVSDGAATIVVDPACKKRRLADIAAHGVLPGDSIILCSHHHPDHWANAGRIARGAMCIVFHPDTKAILARGFFRFCYGEYLRILRTSPAGDIFPRVLGIGGIGRRIARFMLSRLHRLTALGIYVITARIYGKTGMRRASLRFLEWEESSDFVFGATTVRGWRLSENCVALHTPGHAPDTLSLLVRDRRALFIADSSAFLNPVSDHDGTIAGVHENVARLLAIVTSEKIEILLPSHAEPVVGHAAILEFLRSYDASLREVESLFGGIIAARAEWRFGELADTIWRHDHPLARDLVKSNWPRTMSNIDLYLLMLLPEIGYRPLDSRRERWRRESAIRQ